MTLTEEAAAWIDQDPEPRHRQTVQALVDAGDLDGLAALFGGRLSFGTAGLRAAVGPGPRRMNQLVVRQTTQGLLRWMQHHGAGRPKVVVGFDARHGSRDFAREVASTVGRAGGEAILCDDVVPTPALALAIHTHEADAGIMITASHNPPGDNGYKLYLGDGIQIIPPADAEIATAIDEIAAGAPAPSFDSPASPQVLAARRWIDAHRRTILPLIPGPERYLHVVYTALHGVGGAPFLTAALEAGFPRPRVVTAQFDPDPDFPTVPFPNPEEPGALDLALDLARAEQADAVIAHDPDADRLAVAVPTADGTDWAQLRGDQVGVLLGHHLIEHHLAGGGGPAVVAKSLVSSRQLEAIAEAAGVECRTTLTGFKWVARPIVEQPESRYLLGYEEALGYCVGDRIRDKDGISAALVMMEFLASVKAAGQTAWDVLDELDRRFGAYRTDSFSHRLSAGGPGVDEILAGLLEHPPEGASAVTELVDLRRGERFPPTDGVVIRYADRTRIIVRPSGTEPKVKFYLEAVGTPEGAERALKVYAEQLRNRL